MEQLYLCKNQNELTRLEAHSVVLLEGVDGFIGMLQNSMQVTELPRCIVWTEYNTATKLMTELPLPAYTDDYRTVMTPYLDVWKEIYLSQLEEYDFFREDVGAVRLYYEHLPINQLRQIFGHEFVHWSEYFWDDLYEEALWFEEGMAEYISRKWYLSDTEYQAEKKVNQILVSLYEEKFGEHPVEEFNLETREKGLTTIFYFYWKSFLKVESLINHHGGDIEELLLCYQRWGRTKREVTLSDWFDMH